MNSTHHLILASNSPRRQELLLQAGYEFEVFVRDFDESFPAEMPASHVAQYLAEQKNKNYRALRPHDLIITADTTVVNDGTVLNKPADKAEAMEMLTMLSDKTHLVISGVCISSPEQTISFSDTTEVTFSKIMKEEMEYYVDTFRPFDKAGAYGIQEWIGMTKVRSLKGSYFNVMGLPVHRVYEVLKEVFQIR